MIFIDAEEFGTLMMRTSASGEARSEQEAYTAVLDVADIDAGLYHYNVPEYSLELITAGDFREDIASMCHGQTGVTQTSAMIIMSALVRHSESEVPVPSNLPDHVDER